MSEKSKQFKAGYDNMKNYVNDGLVTTEELIQYIDDFVTHEVAKEVKIFEDK
jgi:hypothetical protein